MYELYVIQQHLYIIKWNMEFCQEIEELILNHILIKNNNSMDHIPSWQVNSIAAIQEHSYHL